MTMPTARATARWTLYATLAWNAGLVLVDVVGRRYEAAGFLLIVVAFLATWAWLVPKIDGQLDARLGQAIAQRKTAEIALGEFERLHRAGTLQIDVRVHGRAEGRMH